MQNNQKQSYGGFLPLELNPGTEWFDRYKQNRRSFNTVKAGLDFLIRQLGIREISIPYYYCPSTTKAIKDTGVSVHFYHIDEKLMPESSAWEKGEAILLVNYFGVLEQQIAGMIHNQKEKIIILDNAHAFFAVPPSLENIYTLYSAKKFFGVPDGAYLVGKNVKASKDAEEYAAEYLHYSAVAFERGTDAAYHEKKEVDKMLSSHYAGMSILAHGLLCNVDYQRVKNSRESNFSWLRKQFLKENELEIRDDAPAYLFPLLCRNGEEAKRKLIENRVFVPTLWSGEDLLVGGNEFELHMARDAIFLPIDQRYDRDDMQYVADLTKEILSENT